MAEKKVPPPRPKLCFVIGPIGKDGEEIRKHSDLLLNSVIKQVLEAEPFGYHVKRADEDSDPGMIGDRVITDIINAELVVADLTNLNPNAFYELGIRHASEKPAIHIARAGTALPFDNIAHRTIFVDLTDWHSTEKARHVLAEMAKYIEQPGFKVSNPITQANASFKMRGSADPKDQVLAELRNDMQRIERELNLMRPVAAHREGVPVKGQFKKYVDLLKFDLRTKRFRTESEAMAYLAGAVDRRYVKSFDAEFFDGVLYISLDLTDGRNEFFGL